SQLVLRAERHAERGVEAPRQILRNPNGREPVERSRGDRPVQGRSERIEHGSEVISRLGRAVNALGVELGKCLGEERRLGARARHGDTTSHQRVSGESVDCDTMVKMAEETTLARAMIALAREGRTGILEARGEAVRSNIYIVDGLPVYADGGVLVDTL